MALLIVVVSQSKPVDVDLIPKDGEKSVLAVSPTTFFVRTGDSAAAYSAKLRKKLNASFYVIAPSYCPWDGEPGSEEIEKWIDGELTPPDANAGIGWAR